tara:strand:- start:1142 stop:1366 length:225 start_codon:yes stop_codon:yes gene_type:complete
MSKYSTPIEDITECPHCGSDFGYYTRSYASGWVQDNTLFSGEKYNSGLHDNLTYSRNSKFYFCMECDKRIARVE